MSASRAIVIGGGYAGLAAAWRLARAGVPVSLFERSGHLGGLAMTRPLGTTEVEKYYHHWFTSDDDILDLVEELGLSHHVRWISPVMGMFCGGRLYRFMSPADLLRFRPFSLAAKARFALVTLFLQHYPRKEPFEDVTAASWLRRWAGPTVYGTVWGPLLEAKFGRRAGEISMAWIWNKMRLRGRSRTRGGTRESLGYFDGGFGVLTRAIASAIERRGGTLHRAERVESVEQLPDGTFRVRTTRRQEHAGIVVSTVAPPLLSRLASGLPESFRAWCEGIDHAGIVCTHLVLRRSFSPIYWMNISDREIPFGGLIEHTNFVPPSAYGERRLLYVSHYVYEDDPVWPLEAGEILDRYRAGLRRIRPDFDAGWIEQINVFRDRWAQPIVTAGYQRRLLPLETPWPGLFVATMAQVYPEDRGTNYAVRIGTRAAEAGLARLEGRQRSATADAPGSPS